MIGSLRNPRFFVHPVLLAAGFLFSAAAAGSETRAFRLLESTGRGCTIEFRLTDLEMDSVRLGGNEYLKIDFREGRTSGEAGEPMIPNAVATVAVPAEGGVRVTLLESEPGPGLENVRLLPRPRLRREENLPSEIYEEGPGYRAAGNAREPAFSASVPERFGPYRVVRIRFSPVSYDAESRTLRTFSRLTVAVEFDRPAAAATAQPARTPDGSVYRGSLLNFATASAWAIPAAAGLRRTAGGRRAGEYYKIPIVSEDVYSISGSYLKNAGVDIASIDPSTLKIFNNGGKPLPSGPEEARPDSLVENPILVFGAEDGRFDASDHLIFYGRGPSGFHMKTRRFEHYLNPFTESNVYWLAFNDGRPGLRVQTAPAVEPATPTGTFTDFQFVQNDKGNPLSGGMFWYSYLFQTGDAEPVVVPVPAVDPAGGDAPSYRIQFKGEDMDDSVTETFSVSVNGRSIGSYRVLNATTGVYAFSDPGGLKSSGNAVSVRYSATMQSAKGYLSWVEVQYRRNLAARDNRLRFFSPAEGGAWRYGLTGFTAEPAVWDVTDPASIRALAVTAGDGGYRVSDSADSGNVRVYFARGGSSYPAPSSIEKDVFAGLRNADRDGELLILAPAAFMEAANRYADFKRSFDSLSVVVADVDEVFDEFGWGIRDPAAVRDFVRYAFLRWNRPPAYLLLLGDGHYDYRNRLSGSGTNWIPPYEVSGIQTLYSPAADDWFAWVSGDDALADLAVGRAPVESADQAAAVVDKWIRYQSEPDRGDWRSLITIVADDEFGKSASEVEHVNESERLAARILPAEFNQRKIYLTEYPVEIQTRRLKPQAEDDLVGQINAGTLLVNFTGHANKSVWTHEYIFQQDADMKRLENGSRLPLFYAATCEFGLFDDPKSQSFCEDLLAAPGRGGVAVIGSTRFSYSDDNTALNQEFMAALFADPFTLPRIGDAMRMAKSRTLNRSNDQKYAIIGDPSLRLASPRRELVFTSVDPETLSALGHIRVSGEVRRDGERWDGFNGKVRVQAVDSKKSIRYTTVTGLSVNYLLPGNPMFRGENDVTNGRFEIEFIVPKDITYGGGQGRLSGYAWNEATDGFGYRDNLVTGGSAPLDDRQGPEIRIGFQGLASFMSGDMVAGDPVLSAEIADPLSGINLTGELGHKITLALDDGMPVDVGSAFNYDAGSFLKGRVVYALSGVASGTHQLTLKAWDNANNSSVQTVEFRSVREDALILENLLNYPNPFGDATQFTFEVSRPAEAEIRIFTVDGRRIRRIENLQVQPGFNWVDWDGRDDRGDRLSNGVYLYTVTCRANDGGRRVEASEVGKCIVMR
jgi:hypothetical protein